MFVPTFFLVSAFLQVGKFIITPYTAQIVVSITINRYNDEAGKFAYEVGLPGKSGVGGGIVAVHPNQYVLTVWSPRGNSYLGMKVLEKFTTRTEASVF